jgi:hypothetical protein
MYPIMFSAATFLYNFFITQSNACQFSFTIYIQFLTGEVHSEYNTLPEDLETNLCKKTFEGPMYSVLRTKEFSYFVT